MPPVMQKKKLWCKSAQFMKKNSDLQLLLIGALKKFKKAGERKELVFGTNEVRLISYFREEKGALYGVMLSYEKGKNQLILPEDDDAETLSVEQVAPPVSEDGKRREFLEGVLYFLIHRNHVLTIQSSALRSVQLENHLGWLLGKAGSFKDNGIALADQISSVTREKIRRAHAKEIYIDVPIVSAPSEATEESSAAAAKSDSFEVSGLGMGWLKSLLPDHDFQRMKFADALDANLECTLRVRYKRSSTDNGHKLLDNLALALRHVDDGETIIKLAGGGTVTGNEIKLSKEISVQTLNGVINPDDAFHKMHSWFADAIRDGLIEP